MSEPEPTIVDLILAGAGLTPGAEELAVFRVLYPILRARADSIYAVELGDAP